MPAVGIETAEFLDCVHKKYSIWLKEYMQVTRCFYHKKALFAARLAVGDLPALQVARTPAIAGPEPAPERHRTGQTRGAPPRDPGRVSVACQRHRESHVREGMAAMCMWRTGGEPRPNQDSCARSPGEAAEDP